MNNTISEIEGNYELRQLSLLADRASLGLGLYLEGKKELQFLRDGVKFCEIVEKNLENEKFENEGYDRSSDDFKSAILKRDTYSPSIKEYGDTKEKLLLMIKDIKNRIKILITNEENNNRDEDFSAVIELQKKLNTISVVFYNADISNLRRMKDKRSLRAYG